VTLTVSLRFSVDSVIRVGTLSEFNRDSVFEYDAGFLARGLNVAPFRLPLKPGVQVYDRSGNMETFGLFEDSLPDGWGQAAGRRFRSPVKGLIRPLPIWSGWHERSD